MKKPSIVAVCCLLLLGAMLALVPLARAEEERTPSDLSRELKEMPVLTGQQWQTLQPDTKIAFIWGIGHVVTIEENVMQRHPELRRQGFSAKLAEGLRGVPMNSIIRDVDHFYRNNPDDLDLPVMRVIWADLVRPKLKTGIAGRPLTNEADQPPAPVQ
jgi:hypothetical protein